MADPKRERAGLLAEQNAAAAAYARKRNATNRVRLRRAQQALIDYDRRHRVTATPSSGAGSRATVDFATQRRVNAGDPGAQTTKPAVDLKDPNVARWIQTILKNTGFYKGRIDGIWGPQSEAAHAAWVAAGRPEAPAAPAPAASSTGTGAIGSEGAPGFGGGTATGATAATATLPAASSNDDIRQKYPSFAAFLDIPEVAEILRSAVGEGWPPEKLQARLQATTWWRATPQKARAWLGLASIDPATADRQVQDQKAKLRDAWNDWLPGVTVSDVTLEQWSRKVMSGEVGDDAYSEYLRTQAKSMFPALAADIDRGVTPAQYYEPYRQVAASVLEVAPESIAFADPKWSKPLTHINKEGQRVPMSLSDWQNELRLNPIYGFDNTSTARAQAAEMNSTLLKTFGRA